MKRLLFGILVLAGGLAQVPAGHPLESNRLWIRDARAVNAPWQPIGRAQRLVAMAMLNGRLYGASVAYYILERAASPGDAGWTIIGDAWLISAMTALDGKLYVANREGLVGVSRPVRNMYFNKIGESRGVIGMAALDGNIYAVTRDGRLLAWEDAAHTPVRWIDIGRADRVTALAALDGQLYAATSDNRLFARETALQDRPWKLIGHAENVTAMAAFNGKLYAAAYSPWLAGIPYASTTCVLWETNQLYSEARNFLRAAKQSGRIKDRQECLKLADDSQALQKQAGGQQLAEVIAGSCARCACAAEF
jgi:outer membrane protein assembly factor BamB